MSRDGAFSKSTSRQFNAYTDYGRLMEQYDANGDHAIEGVETVNGQMLPPSPAIAGRYERTEGLSEQTSYGGSDTNFLFDVDPSDTARVLPLDWKTKGAAQRQ